MVVINSGIMQNQIIKIVEGCKDYKYTYVKKDGIKLYFDVDTDEEEKAAAAAKKAIKDDSIGKTSLISVKVEK